MTMTTSCANAQATKPKDNNKKILVVYYSWSGNTEAVAKQIQAATGADIFEIELVKPFSTDYNTVAREYKEDNCNGTVRKLKNTVDNISDYDVVFIGTPIWGNTRALPVKSFLLEHNLSGITVAPFATHAGGGAGSCFADMKNDASQAVFFKGLSLVGGRGSAKADVEKWLNEIGVTK